MPRKPALAPNPPSLSAAEPQARTVRCPACGGPSLYGPANRWRPFCGERCKLQDLGAWASERFRVAVDPSGGADDDAITLTGNSGPLVH